MTVLNIDIETFSSVGLGGAKGRGVYRYAESEDFEILLFAFSVDGGPVQVVDLAKGDKIPTEIYQMLGNPRIIKQAFNASFERVCISEHIKRHYSQTSLGLWANLTEDGFLDPVSWQCSMVDASRAGFMGGLDAVAKAFGLGETKDPRGDELIKFFSIPVKPTKANGGKTRNFPEDDPEAWKEYIEYNRQDVVVEMEVRKVLDKILPNNKQEMKMWEIDQEINDRGIMLDRGFIESAALINDEETERLRKKMNEVSGLANANSPVQLKEWLATHGIETDTTNKAFVSRMLKRPDTPAVVKEVLSMRQAAGLASTAKYNKLIDWQGDDDRMRGAFQFYGAYRTGRWAGRGPQPQNLTKHDTDRFNLNQVRHVRELIRHHDLQTLELIYGDVPVKSILSQMLRTSIIARPGHKFIVSDFSAIEARVIAWYASEEWRLEVFRTHGKIYEASASEMFKIPLEEITKDSPYRAKGKVAELALGYQGGGGALLAMGAAADYLKDKDYEHLDITEEEIGGYIRKKKARPEAKERIQFIAKEMQGLVDTWRKANPGVVQFWYDSEDAAVKAIKNPGKSFYVMGGKVSFTVARGSLYVRLPSGRALVYPSPRLVPRKIPRKDGGYFEKEGIEFRVLSSGRGLQWEGTYGGKLVENIVQATARDILVESIIALRERGYKLVMHVHDEVVIEAPDNKEWTLEEVEKIMSVPVKWAPGLPLGADGFESDFYYSD